MSMSDYLDLETEEKRFRAQIETWKKIADAYDPE